MTTPAIATLTITLKPSGCVQERSRTSLARTPRVARLLALAHEIERRIRAGEIEDLAHAARVLGLTRARVTQVSQLVLLAPAIQERILTMPPMTVGREQVTERGLRSVLTVPVWGRQIEIWKERI